ncbi:iron-containing alcohol dehydrogenase [Shouchella sp. JSM 1781072]|uniref:iron-containing alcohol dehydrogenase n=1 Tax=Shouchella sp. JSM 1781072 TaxID=3344581 RepID=UPI0035BFD4E5
MSQVDFQFLSKTAITFGSGSSQLLAEELTKRGLQKPLLLTDNGLIESGLVKAISKVLENSNIAFKLFSDIPPNPPSTVVHTVVDQINQNGCDAIIALGGGSVIDTAKAASVLSMHDGDILEYESTRSFSKPGLPLLVIPTTSGTGSEVTMWSVITDETKKRKASIGSPFMFPDLALVDPLLLHGLPPHLTAATGMDALTHAIEGYTSIHSLNGKAPLTDAILLQAIRLLSASLRQAVSQGTNALAREQTMAGSLLAGIAFQNVGLGNAHALAHALGGRIGIPHGVANAIALPEVMMFNLRACPDRFKEIAAALDENVTGLSTIAAAERAVEAVRQLRLDLEIPTLSTYNVQETEWEALAVEAFQDMNRFTNPRQTSQDQLLALYKQMNK